MGRKAARRCRKERKRETTPPLPPILSLSLRRPLCIPRGNGRERQRERGREGGRERETLGTRGKSFFARALATVKAATALSQKVFSQMHSRPSHTVYIKTAKVQFNFLSKETIAPETCSKSFLHGSEIGCDRGFPGTPMATAPPFPWQSNS